MMERIVAIDRSVIPACDVAGLENLEKLVSATCGVEGIGGYKVGLSLDISFGLREVVDTIRKFTELPIIYDRQKAGTDIPDLGVKFASECKDVGVDAVIIFPMAGAATEEAWIKACQDKDLGVIIGGEMTHPQYLYSEGGYIVDSAPVIIYLNALRLGVVDFVVPGNKPEKIKYYREMLGLGSVFYSPGLIAQGGEITEAASAAGNRWHAIIGRGLYMADDIQSAAEEYTSRLTF